MGCSKEESYWCGPLFKEGKTFSLRDHVLISDLFKDGTVLCFYLNDFLENSLKFLKGQILPVVNIFYLVNHNVEYFMGCYINFCCKKSIETLKLTRMDGFKSILLIWWASLVLWRICHNLCLSFTLMISMDIMIYSECPV